MSQKDSQSYFQELNLYKSKHLSNTCEIYNTLEINTVGNPSVIEGPDCQHQEFADGTLGVKRNEVVFEFLNSLKSLLAETKRCEKSKKERKIFVYNIYLIKN